MTSTVKMTFSEPAELLAGLLAGDLSASAMTSNKKLGFSEVAEYLAELLAGDLSALTAMTLTLKVVVFFEAEEYLAVCPVENLSAIVMTLLARI